MNFQYQIETGDLNTQESEQKEDKGQKGRVFVTEGEISADEKIAQIVQNFEKEIEISNLEAQGQLTMNFGRFQIKFSKSCHFEFPKKEEPHDIKECNDADAQAKKLVYSQTHFLLKQIKTTKTNSISLINQKTKQSMQCYLDTDVSVVEEVKPVSQTNIFQVCFNNAYSYYMEELQMKLLEKTVVNKQNDREIENEIGLQNQMIYQGFIYDFGQFIVLFVILYFWVKNV